jgi:IrrE N-terminal-like domain
VKKVRNSYLERIASAVGEPDHRRAVALLLSRYRRAGDSLDSVARNLGVGRVVEEPLPFEGGTFELPDGSTIIKISSHDCRRRRRFTLAHELGHLVMATLYKQRMCCRRSPALESACDSIAAELLMPFEEAALLVRRLGTSSPENLRTIAREFDVSWQAAAVRVHYDLRLWKCSVGMWDCSSSPTEVWFVGRRLWGTRRPDFAAFEEAQHSSACVRVVESVRRAGWTELVSLQLLSVGGDQVLGLVGGVR